MTTKQKNELIAAVTALLEKMIPFEEDTPTITVSKPALPEMLTIKECAALVPGLTEHTVRMLVKQDKVKYQVRTGRTRKNTRQQGQSAEIPRRSLRMKKIELCPTKRDAEERCRKGFCRLVQE